MKLFFMVIFNFLIVACNSSGGGAGSTPDSGGDSSGNTIIAGCMKTTATNYNSQASSDDGSCVGGHGETGFYGFKTSGSVEYFRNLNPTTASNSNDLFISDEFYLKLNIPEGRNYDAGIYMPLCLTTGQSHNYAVVSVEGSFSTSATIKVEPTQISITRHSLQEPGRIRHNVDTTVYPVTCSYGEIKLSSPEDGSFFANGKMIIGKINNNFLVGIESSTQVLNTNILAYFDTYAHTDDQNCTLGTCSLVASSGLHTFSSYVINNALNQNFAGDGDIYPYSNHDLATPILPTRHQVVHATGGSWFEVLLLAQLGTNKLRITTIPHRDNCDNQTENYCEGAISISFGVAN